MIVFVSSRHKFLNINSYPHTWDMGVQCVPISLLEQTTTDNKVYRRVKNFLSLCFELADIISSFIFFDHLWTNFNVLVINCFIHVDAYIYEYEKNYVNFGVFKYARNCSKLLCKTRVKVKSYSYTNSRFKVFYDSARKAQRLKTRSELKNKENEEKVYSRRASQVTRFTLQKMFLQSFQILNCIRFDVVWNIKINIFASSLLSQCSIFSISHR